jgi:hypothetical protein
MLSPGGLSAAAFAVRRENPMMALIGLCALTGAAVGGFIFAFFGYYWAELWTCEKETSED